MTARVQMAEDALTERARNIAVEHLGVEREKVTEDASFVDDLGADSLDTVELVMAFEEEFEVEIPDDDFDKFTTFGDAVAWLRAAKAGGPS
jgi:acyl carrier protein